MASAWAPAAPGPGPTPDKTTASSRSVNQRGPGCSPGTGTGAMSKVSHRLHRSLQSFTAHLKRLILLSSPGIRLHAVNDPDNAFYTEYITATFNQLDSKSKTSTTTTTTTNRQSAAAAATTTTVITT
eukprot:scaffold48171_cov35-Prasinocladus_malaysianus.AAC.1